MFSEYSCITMTMIMHILGQQTAAERLITNHSQDLIKTAVVNKSHHSTSLVSKKKLAYEYEVK